VQLREFFAEDAINLHLDSTNKDAVLKELVGLLKLDEKNDALLYKMLKRRETLGSTGIGQNIAIPHCRSLVVAKLRVAFARKLEGVDFGAIDGKPVHYFFLIAAPRGLEPIPTRARQDRAVCQGAGRARQARETADTTGIPETVGREEHLAGCRTLGR
jgi:mannitol/fructose-specific phosphotransferase system IIA component (Ntr-type)